MKNVITWEDLQHAASESEAATEKRLSLSGVSSSLWKNLKDEMREADAYSDATSLPTYEAYKKATGEEQQAKEDERAADIALRAACKSYAAQCLCYVCEELQSIKGSDKPIHYKAFRNAVETAAAVSPYITAWTNYSDYCKEIAISFDSWRHGYKGIEGKDSFSVSYMLDDNGCIDYDKLQEAIEQRMCCVYSYEQIREEAANYTKTRAEKEQVMKEAKERIEAIEAGQQSILHTLEYCTSSVGYYR